VVELAHHLGLRAVGEGVETEAAQAILVECGCDRGQGFLLGRPASADALPALSPAAA
jgi:EAL domain-containing protein (putative c-di-GMP-specific phosphodiesterase class I)